MILLHFLLLHPHLLLCFSGIRSKKHLIILKNKLYIMVLNTSGTMAWQGTALSVEMGQVRK